MGVSIIGGVRCQRFDCTYLVIDYMYDKGRILVIILQLVRTRAKKDCMIHDENYYCETAYIKG